MILNEYVTRKECSLVSLTALLKYHIILLVPVLVPCSFTLNDIQPLNHKPIHT